MDDSVCSPAFEIRVAETREERERVFRFRFDRHIAEFGRWPTPDARDRKILREAADEGAILLFTEWEERIVATLRLQIGPIPPDVRSGLEAWRFRCFAPGELAVADRILVARAFRRTTLFADLLAAAEREAAALGAALLFCHAREEEAHLWASKGYLLFAPPFAIAEESPRHPLVKAVGGPSAEAWLDAELATASRREPKTDRKV